MSQKDHQAIVVCGLGFGDECKGSITDYLARIHQAHAVVRYNGGAQAAHNVVLSNGKHHTFSQFGSATFVPGVQTFLSRFMLVNPISMMDEANVLAGKGINDAFERTTIDGRSLVITPFHSAVNRLRELSRGAERLGSCGQGIGETIQDAKIGNDFAVRINDLRDWSLLQFKLDQLQDLAKRQVQILVDRLPDNEIVQKNLFTIHSDRTILRCLERYKEFTDLCRIVSDDHMKHVLDRQGTVIFEGAQGVLLDERHGFFPHVTWTDTTTANAHTLIRESDYYGKVTDYGLLRAYATRHGCGPFVTEDSVLTRRFRDKHNGLHEWQQGFRVGWFDLIAARYALDVAGNIDRLVISCLDRLKKIKEVRVCIAYTHLDFQDAGYFFRDMTENRGRLRIQRLWKTDRDKVHQEKLTKILGKCHPEYRTFPSSEPRKYLRFIQDQLKLPVAIISSGSTEKDKVTVRL